MKLLKEINLCLMKYKTELFMYLHQQEKVKMERVHRKNGALYKTNLYINVIVIVLNIMIYIYYSHIIKYKKTNNCKSNTYNQ